MAFDQIEKIKREYTDKYVMVDAKRPELARFRDLVGRVKTVNMSGRALVEFDDYHLNIGWYDIDLDFLKVVDKPKPKPKEEKPAPKPAAKKQASPAAGGEKKLSPLEMARQQGAGDAKAKSSVADILAAARGKKPDAAKAEAAAPAPPAEQPAPVKVAPAAEPVAEAPSTPPPASSTPSESPKLDRSTMNIEQMLAYCREHDAG